MSFEIMTATFRDGDAVTYDRTIAERAFAGLIAKENRFGWELKAPECGAAFVDIEDAAQISGFDVSRPPRYAPFWDAVFEVIEETRGVVFWPDGGMCVTDQSVVAELPADMIESFSEPTVVANGSQILDAIESGD